MNCNWRTKERIALDCEMVDVGTNLRRDALARVSLVDEEFKCVYDKYVKPQQPVTDYRTIITGITKATLDLKGEDFDKVRKEVQDLIRGRVLVGHALETDFSVLNLEHPDEDIIDTSRITPFKNDNVRLKTPALKYLAQKYLYIIIQEGRHSSVVDATAAMKLSFKAVPKAK
ncbi:RNA exonuclease 4-like [Aphomia sociella]